MGVGRRDGDSGAGLQFGVRWRITRYLGKIGHDLQDKSDGESIEELKKFKP